MLKKQFISPHIAFSIILNNTNSIYEKYIYQFYKVKYENKNFFLCFILYFYAVSKINIETLCNNTRLEYKGVLIYFFNAVT